MKKIRSFLFEYDFIWSIPVAFIGFVLFPIIGQAVFGEGFGFYPPEFFHAGVYAGLLGILLNSLTQMFLFFNFPVQYDYYLQSGFEKLEEWQKAALFLFLYVFCFSSLLGIWLAIV